MRLKREEAVAVFEIREDGERVTYIFGTERAVNGTRQAGTPELYQWEGEQFFVWSGFERKRPYSEVIYSDRGGYSMRAAD